MSYDNDQLLKDCYLNLQLQNETLGTNPHLRSTKRGTIDESVKREIPFKNAIVRNHCNTLRMYFSGNYAVEFRVFDNGIAYRFVTDKKGDNIVMGEDFAINFPTNYKAHLSQPDGFKTSYECPYTHVDTEKYAATDRMSYLPVLIETDKAYKILISEADYIAKTDGKRSFPWRMMVISKEDKELIENEMVYNLSAPCVLEDYSWIKPGQVSWEWWHDARLYGVDFRSGFNMDSYKYYIDFASKFGIPYIIMDEGWAKNTRDPFTPNPTINLTELIKYGKDRNVKIVLWLPFRPL